MGGDRVRARVRRLPARRRAAGRRLRAPARVRARASGVFTAASLACGLAPGAASAGARARAVQGLGAALTAPAALALIVDAFPRAIVSAVAVWTGVAAVGGASGLVLGGVIADDARLALGVPRSTSRSGSSRSRSRRDCCARAATAPRGLDLLAAAAATGGLGAARRRALRPRRLALAGAAALARASSCGVSAPPRSRWSSATGRWRSPPPPARC